jgi:hypothetical protein
MQMGEEEVVLTSVNLDIVLLRDVVLSINDPDSKRIGGNIRTAKRMEVTWVNRTDREVMLRFEEWEIDRVRPVTPGDPAEPVWPFSRFRPDQNPGVVVDVNEGLVRISRGSGFKARLAGIGRMIVKYSVYVPQANGAPDPAFIALDPMIVVER